MSEFPEEYEVLDLEDDEDEDIKPDIDAIAASQIEFMQGQEEYTIETGGGEDDGEAFDGIQALTDIQQRLQIVEGRFDDLEERIEQKFQTMMRKQDQSFALITTKLDILLKAIGNRSSSVTSAAPLKRVAVNSLQKIAPPTKKVNENIPETFSSPPPTVTHPITFVAKSSPRVIRCLPAKYNFLGKRLNPVPILPKNTNNIALNMNPDEILRSRPLVRTMSDMLLFENNLQINTYRQSVLTNIKMIGGNTMQSEIGNILKSLLSNTVQANYSFKGAKGKDSFNSTFTWDVIRQCIQERYPGTTMDQIKKGVSDLLRNAPGKLKKG